MTAVSFPTSPAPADASPRLMRYGGDLTPPLGGAVQRITRIGSRFAVDFTYPPMTRTQAAAMIAALLRAEAEGLTLLASWPGPAALSLGSPLVAGAGQAGTTLNADAFTPGVLIPAGTPFSFTANSRTYLHVTSADVTANGSGVAALPAAPMLRAAPADNAALSFAAPQIEGLASGDALGWTLNTAQHYGLSFTLSENE